MHRIMRDPVAMRYWSTLPHDSLETTADWVRSMLDPPPDNDDFIVTLNGDTIGKLGAWQLPDFGYLARSRSLGPRLCRRGACRLSRPPPRAGSAFSPPTPTPQRRQHPPAPAPRLSRNRAGGPDLADRRPVVRQHLLAPRPVASPSCGERLPFGHRCSMKPAGVAGEIDARSQAAEAAKGRGLSPVSGAGHPGPRLYRPGRSPRPCCGR